MRLTMPPVRAKLTNPTLVTALAVAADGADVIVGQMAGGKHPALSRWSLPDLAPLPGPERCPLAGGNEACHVLARGEGELVAVAGGASKQLTIMDLASGEMTAPVEDEVVWAQFSGPLLATSGVQTEIRDLNTGRLVWRQDPPAPRGPAMSESPPLIAMHPDRQTFAVGGSGDRTVLVHSMADGGVTATLTGAPARLRWLGFGPSGGYVVAADVYAKSTVVWRSGETQPHLPDVFGEEQYVSVAFHPDGEHCAMGMWSGYVDVYRLSDGELIDSQQLHTGQVRAMAFTPDGSILLSGGDDGKLLARNVVA
jgi:WD domain, G-beta repeat